MAVANRFGNMSNSQEVQSIALLGATQMIEMLALPEGDEQQFIDQMAENGTPVDEMSVRELKAAVKQYKQDKDDADAAIDFTTQYWQEDKRDMTLLYKPLGALIILAVTYLDRSGCDADKRMLLFSKLNHREDD